MLVGRPTLPRRAGAAHARRARARARRCPRVRRHRRRRRLGRTGPGPPARRRRREADLGGGRRAVCAALGLTPMLLTGDHEGVARSVAAEVGIDDRDRRRPACRQGRRGQAAAGRGQGRRHGRRRRERRRRTRPGRPRAGDGHRERRRDRGRRPDPGARRPAGRRRRDPALPADTGRDQGQPVLGVRLQHRRDPAGRRRPAEPDAGRRRDGRLVGVRGHQQPAAEGLPAHRHDNVRSTAG